MQKGLFDFEDSQENKERVILDYDGKIIYYPNFFKASLFKQLEAQINWQQDQITLYGKTHNIPRLQAWYADRNLKYSYSGVMLKTNPFSTALGEIRTDIEIRLKNSFNSCLCNLYRNGEDYAAWHSDDEKELGRNPVIASASFGGTRKIVFKHKTDKGQEKIEIELENNSLLLMSGALQHKWKHQLNKTKKDVDARINLTFRNILG